MIEEINQPLEVFTPYPNGVFHNAVDDWLEDSESANSTYGHISTWDTYCVTDMSYAFWYVHTFNEDISGWDTSNVTNMELMFEYASDFNQDIGDWDVSSVTDMSGMFSSADNFKQDI